MRCFGGIRVWVFEWEMREHPRGLVGEVIKVVGGKAKRWFYEALSKMGGNGEFWMGEGESWKIGLIHSLIWVWAKRTWWAIWEYERGIHGVVHVLSVSDHVAINCDMASRVNPRDLRSSFKFVTRSTTKKQGRPGDTPCTGKELGRELIREKISDLKIIMNQRRIRKGSQEERFPVLL